MSIVERIPVVVAEPKSPFASAGVVVMVSPEENVLYPSVALLASICERYSSEIVVAPT